MITRDDVVNGYMHGAVKFKNARNFYGMDEVCCCIGHGGVSLNWFYFGGMDAEGKTPMEFIHEVGIDNVLTMVTNTLNDCIREIDKDEYAFYECVLNEYKEEAC